MAPGRRNTPRKPPAARHAARRESPGEGWIWGRHAVLAALANPRRKILSLHVTRNASNDLSEAARAGAKIELPGELDAKLPPGAVHQGFALRAGELDCEPLAAVTDPTHGLLVVLDQITDPQNAGAIMRSAAAFGARAVIMQDRKAPPLFGALCKAAAGCAETLSHVRVTNIADTLAELRRAGRFAAGLAGESETPLHQALAGPSGEGCGPGLVLVMGAEDKGLRPRVAENCDVLARIPMSPGVESLNVSTAAAVALYEAWRWRIGA